MGLQRKTRDAVRAILEAGRGAEPASAVLAVGHAHDGDLAKRQHVARQPQQTTRSSGITFRAAEPQFHRAEATVTENQWLFQSLRPLVARAIEARNRSFVGAVPDALEARNVAVVAESTGRPLAGLGCLFLGEKLGG